MLSPERKSEAPVRVLRLNGQDVPLNVPARFDMTVIQFLHFGPFEARQLVDGKENPQPHRYLGTKLGCGQGGCGACTVALRVGKTVRPVNSCLFTIGQCAALCAAEGAEIITIEGLDNDRKQHIEPHASQPNAWALTDPRMALIKVGGSQCGFCSPGFVMNMHTYQCQHAESGAPMQEPEIEDLFGGNICRCTGFRSILCGFKELGEHKNKAEMDATPEAATEWETYAARLKVHEHVTVIYNNEWNMPITTPSSSTPMALTVSPRRIAPTARAVTVRPPPPRLWLFPTTYKQLHKKYQWLLQSVRPEHIRFVVGNTSLGVFPEEQWRARTHKICLLSIPNQKAITANRLSLTCGAGVTLADLMEKCLELSRDDRYDRLVQQQMTMLRNHLRRVAGRQVRNLATLGGSIALALLHRFPADAVVALAAVGATFTYCDLSLSAKINKKDMLVSSLLLKKRNNNDFATGCQDFLIYSISIPLDSDACRAKSRIFRTAQRMQNSHPLVNAGVRLDIDENKAATDATVLMGFDIEHIADRKHGIKRFPVVEQFLCQASGLPAAEALSGLRRAFDQDMQTVGSPDHPVYRNEQKIAAFGFLTKFVLQHVVAEKTVEVSDTDDLYAERKQKCTEGQQDVTVNVAKPPISEPIRSQTLLNHASGSTEYTHNIQFSDECWHVAPVLSKRATGLLNLASKDETIPTLLEHFRKRWARSLKPDDFRLFYGIDIPADANAFQTDTWHSFKTYVLTPYQVMYDGQPVALVCTKDDWVSREAARYLSDADDFFRFTAFQPEPILSVDESLGKKVDVYIDANTKQSVASAFAVCSLPYEKHVEQSQGSNQCSGTGHRSIEKIRCRYDAEPPQELKEPQAVGADVDINWSTFGESQYLVLEGSHYVGSQAHFYMETQSAIVKASTSAADANVIDLWASTQVAAPLQRKCDKFASILSASPAAAPPAAAPPATASWQVKLKVPFVGGGFGGKEPQSYFVSLASVFLATQGIRPLRFVLSREDDMRIIGKRHAVKSNYKVAVSKATGRIEALEMEYQLDAGCNYDCSLPVLDLMLLSAENAYHIPHLVARGQCYFTNKSSSTAFRTFGVVQANQCTEYAVEKAYEAWTQYCRQQGLAYEDSLSFRRKHFYADSRCTPHHFVEYTPYGQPVRCSNLEPLSSLIDDQCRDTATSPLFLQAINTNASSTASGIELESQAVADFNRAHKFKKRGFAVLPLKYGISFTNIPANVGSCSVTINANGDIILRTSGVEMGQGLYTKMRQLAANELGVDMRLVQQQPYVDATDYSDNVNMPGTGASTGTELNGYAVLDACTKARVAIVDMLAKSNPALLEAYHKNGNKFFRYAVDMKELASRSADVELPAAPTSGTLWTEVINALNTTAPGIPTDGLMFKGVANLGVFLREVNYQKKWGWPFYYFNYGFAHSVIEVDCVTGEVDVLRSDVIYDAGLSLNPLIDVGQVEGGFVQGIGYVTCEDVVHETEGNDKGRLLTPNTWTYKVPTTTEIPRQFNVMLYPFAKATKSGRNKPGWLMEMRKDVYDNDVLGVQSSKATGEPPLVLANTVWFAIRNAVRAYQAENKYDGKTGPCDLECPATTYRILEACHNGKI